MTAGIEGNTALVSGAGAGIGREIALALGREGAAVAVADIAGEAAETVAREIESAGGRAVAFAADVADFAAAEQLVGRVAQELGDPTILVNNAGITRDTLLLRMSEADWDKVLAVNLKGAFNLTKHCARGMIKARRGRVINIASVVGMMGNAGQANYAASKAGLIGLTKSVA
ncbi:SDR family NAD(P)-dependent oxidoreductase, partial [candidate division WOR-3 bacterium]|nr:SDR family NAD(P)-dependent oxidoreductase [candidate division WOR-3 bacterium]